MLEAQPERVQHQPALPPAAERAAVAAITDDGRAKRREVHPNLMLAAGEGLGFDEPGCPPAFDHA